MPRFETSLRSAAVLVSCLDEADADGLLGRLEQSSANRIRGATRVLGVVPRAEREQVMRAFLLEGKLPAESQAPQGVDAASAKTGGVELDDGLAQRFATSRQQGIAAYQGPDSPATQTPFGFLVETEAEVVAPFLSRESPQTVAVVLSFLRRDQAAELLKQFEAPFQVDVLKRLAKLDEVAPECIGVVAEELKTWIARQHEAPRPPASDDAILRDVLAGGRSQDRAALIADLQRVIEISPARSQFVAPAAVADEPAETHRLEATAAHELQPSEPRVPAPPQPTSPTDATKAAEPFQFEDFASLDTEFLLRTFQAAPRDVLTLALAGAESSLIRRITRKLPRREAKQLKRRLQLEGPTRLQDIEAAQCRVAAIAAELLAAR